jgi:methylase of polypeptide subunit release factors
VAELMQQTGFVDVSVHRDAAGRDRVVVSRASVG